MNWLNATLLLTCTLISMTSNAQTTQPSVPEVPLYPDGAPGAKGDTPQDRPAIFPYLAEHGNGTAVIVVPGGGYTHLAIDHEGVQVAEWLNRQNISAFVLRYRYAPYQHPYPMADGLRAVRLVRSRAKEWNIDPAKIGMLGFSAGGHLTSTIGTHFKTEGLIKDDIDKLSARPDFLVLVYPVITLNDPYAHRGSRKSLLGENPDPSLVDLLSNDKQVTAETPPTFLVHSTTDKGVPYQNSVMFHDALEKAGVKSKLLLFDVGGHGYGLGKNDPKLSTWPDECIKWMKELGFF